MVNEVMMLERFELLPHFRRKTAALAAIDQQALEIQARAFAIRPQVAETIDDVRMPLTGDDRSKLRRQRGEPFLRTIEDLGLFSARGFPLRAPVGLTRDVASNVRLADRGSPGAAAQCNSIHHDPPLVCRSAFLAA